MPNWCNNTVELYHDDPAMIERARKAFNDSKFLNEFVPIPESLQIVSGRCGADDNPEQIALEAAQKSNIEQHGYKDWYDFSVNEWGTKWDVGEDGATDIHPDGTMLNTYFDSAWSPPIGAYEKLEQLGFTVDAYYYEGGMAFAGTYSDGNEDSISLEGMTADEIEQDYPDLNEAFGISESMREYEEPEELSEWLKDGIEQKKLLVAE